MMKSRALQTYFSVFLLLIIVLSLVSAQSVSKRQTQAEKAKYQLHPTKQKSSPTGVYIPKDLQDAFIELDRMLPPELRAEMRDGAESEMIRYHLNLGMWIRNNWGLWKGLRLAKWFHQYKIDVPDDMSGMILTSYWRYLHHQPIAFEEQVKATLAYWERAKIAAAKEKERVAAAKAAIREKMMNLQVSGTAKQTVLFPTQPLDPIYVRYMAPFAGGVLVTRKTFLGRRSADFDFTSQCYFLDLTTMTLYPIRLPEMDQVLEGLVLQDKAYFHGLKQGRDVLVAIQGGKHLPLPTPEGTGLLQLGIDQEGDGKSALLAVRPQRVLGWEGQWKTLSQFQEKLPYGILPPQKFGSRLYIRDEGREEDDKQLSWREENSPNAPVYFTQHVGLVGPEGPRWENVWSYLQTPDGTLWISAGNIIGSASLIRWNKETGYRIALWNNGVHFDGELLGEDAREDTPNHTLAITGIATRPDNSLLLIGPHGLFRLQDRRITPLLRFRREPNDWIPTHLLELDSDTFLAGGHFGGIYRFHKGADGLYHVSPLQAKIGAPKTL